MNRLRAITLWRPWSWCILYSGKTHENRTWPLPRHLLGEWVALHAGKRYDAVAWQGLLDLNLCIPPTNAECPTGIVGLVWFDRNDLRSDSRWFGGPVGWHVAEALPLQSPIEINGAQGLWFVPDDARAEIARQIGFEV